MDLALDVGVSPRHLSFVETGRSRPSPELVLAVATHLEVPLRERNTLLLAAGYAPRYSQSSLGDPAMQRVTASLQRMLDAHDPYPGVVIDRQWNVVLANAAASAITAGLPEALRQPVTNVYRICLHPDGLASVTTNFTDWATYLLHQLRRSIVLTGDPELERLAAEVRAYPNVAALASSEAADHWDDPPLLVPFRLRAGDEELSLFTTLTTFGTPRDVTLDELAVELFFPADDRTDVLLRSPREGDASMN
jgi:transcriptional regulator with XRE-family HTH domain